MRLQTLDESLYARIVQRNWAMEDIETEIRIGICLAAPDVLYVLHEAELAERFSVSRTPIRQVLQSLAKEGLVETRRGVGTVASVLSDENRDCAIQCFAEIARAAAVCTEGPMPDTMRIELMGLLSFAERQQAPTEDMFIRMMAKIVSSISGLAEDPILREALQAAHWRLLRWRVIDFRADPEAEWQTVVEHFRAALQRVDFGDRRQILQAVAQVTLQMWQASADR